MVVMYVFVVDRLLLAPLQLRVATLCEVREEGNQARSDFLTWKLALMEALNFCAGRAVTFCLSYDPFL